VVVTCPWFKRVLWVIYAVSVVMAAPAAYAEVVISVDKSTQQMAVSVDGVPRYRFAVSTGRAGYGTPNGTYHPQRLAASWFSKLYYNSPMPHSIFFHGGYAIHGSYDIHRLGGPASHGCIRLHPANAAALFDLVKNEGKDATTIVVSGSNPVVATGSPEAHHHGSRASPHKQSHRRDYARVKPTYDDRNGPDYGWERPAYGDPYRSNYERSDYWRPQSRPFSFFNSY
jgi:L,D-transpeptidase catalytic domain